MTPDAATALSFARTGLRLLDAEEMGRVERAAMTGGVTCFGMMQRAGAAVAECLSQNFAEGPVAVLCGPGNNGGDGLIAAAALRQQGRAVRVFLLSPPEQLRGDAAQALAAWDGPVAMLNDFDPTDVTPSLAQQEPAKTQPQPQSQTHAQADAQPEPAQTQPVVIDALFGGGLNRALGDGVRRTLAAVKEAGLPIVAVDMPSGVAANSGADLGGAVGATLTVTFHRPRPGHYLLPGRHLCGRVQVADIGIPAEVMETALPPVGGMALNGPELWPGLPRRPRPEDHKYTRGQLLIVGDTGMPGAAVLAARAAQRIGAGLVRLAVPERSATLYRLLVQSAIVHPVRDTKGLIDLIADTRPDAALIGPGLDADGAGAQERVLALLRAGIPLLLDAGALTLFAAHRELLFSALHEATLLTPHEGEFRRLFPEDTAESGKPARARMAAAMCGATVLLKGADTVIAAADGRAVINGNAPAELATAGSGDVLSGMIAGLLAGGVGGFHAACAGAWLHGKAGAIAGRGLIAEDLPQAIPAAITAAETVTEPL